MLYNYIVKITSQTSIKVKKHQYKQILLILKFKRKNITVLVDAKNVFKGNIFSNYINI